MQKKPKIVILGAGMSGIACALSLHDNFDVHIYEKSRGVGGRLCAKSLPNGLFHFGAQFCSCLLYTSPSPRDVEESRMPSSA